MELKDFKIIFGVHTELELTKRLEMEWLEPNTHQSYQLT